jgi:hypothetical protein
MPCVPPIRQRQRYPGVAAISASTSGGPSNAAYYEARDAMHWHDARAPRSPTQVGNFPSMPKREAEDLPRGESFPTQSAGSFPAYNHTIGAACTCENGKAGTLQPHPSTSSMLICIENRKDARAVDSTALYYQLRDEMQDEWRRYGPHQDGCGCHDVKDQPGTIGYLNTNQVEWPQGGQVEGGECTVNGAPGRYVKRNGKYVCESRQDMDRASVDARDPEAVREAAWRQSVLDAENEWRRYR